MSDLERLANGKKVPARVLSCEPGDRIHVIAVSVTSEDDLGRPNRETIPGLTWINPLRVGTSVYVEADPNDLSTVRLC